MRRHAIRSKISRIAPLPRVTLTGDWAARAAGVVGALRGVSGVEGTVYVQASAGAPVRNPVATLDVWMVGDAGLVLTVLLDYSF